MCMEIRIDGWRSKLTFDASHFLPDYSKCSRLHGHTYAIHVIIKGEIKEGIVIDFRVVKKALKEIIEELDHKVIIPMNGKLEIKEGEEIEVKYAGKRYVFPKEDCVFLPIYSSSAENLANYILKKFLEKIDLENIFAIKLGIDEGYGQGAWTEWKKQSV
ncbi:MAG: 6-pyruvoyl tetrahydropterin synthase family protein [Thermoplasmata archaeon]|nr:6-pyruvoyl tetrahydropterin synthase family protein [Thermoplasmata archaeon]